MAKIVKRTDEKVVGEVLISVGQIWVNRSTKSLNLLALFRDKVGLVSLSTPEYYWGMPITVDNPKSMTTQELYNITGISTHNFTLYTGQVTLENE